MISDQQRSDYTCVRTSDAHDKTIKMKLAAWMAKSRQTQIRAVTALTGALYIVASEIDRYVAPADIAPMLITLHLYILPPVLFLISLLTFRKESSKLTLFLLALAPIGAAIGNLYIVINIDEPATRLTEIYLIIFWIFTVSGLRLRHAAWSALAVVVIVFVVTYLFFSMSTENFIMHCFWMLAAFSFGFLAAYLLERSNMAVFHQHQQLKQLASTDCLTGLSNRVRLDEILQDELDRSRRFGHTFGLIIMDLDHFKEVNDTYGHQAGDTMLIEVGKLILQHLRSTDRAVRWGGEEFILIYLETDREETLQLAEELRQKIADHHFETVGSKTASFGVTLYHHGDTKDSIIKRADSALYKTKARGRNCVEFL